MKEKFRFNYLAVIGVIFAVCAGGYFFLVNTVMPRYIQQVLPAVEEMSGEYINGSLKIGNLTWQGGLTVELDDVAVKDQQNKNVALVPKARVSLRPWLAFLKAERVLSRIELQEPQIWLRLQEGDKWNLTTLLKESDSQETPFYGLVNVDRGTLSVETPYGNWDFGVAGEINGGANPDFAIDAKVTSPKEELTVTGLMTTDGIGRIKVSTEKFTVDEYTPLVQHYINIKMLAGDLINTHVIWENDGQEAVVSGESEFSGVKGSFSAMEEEHSFILAGKVKAAKSVVDLERLEVVLDADQVLQLRGSADVRDLDNISGQGLLTAPKLSYAGYSVEKVYLPFSADNKLLQLEKGSLAYGGGEIRVNATADLAENTLTADINAENVNHPLNGNRGDHVQANGALAVLGRMETRDGQEVLRLHAAADTFALKWEELLLDRMSFDGDFDSKKLTVDHFSAYTPEGVVSFKGELVPTADGALALEGRIADFEAAPFLKRFANITGKGKLSMGFDVGGTVDAPEFGTMMQLRDVDIPDINLKMREMHGFIGMKNKVLTVTRMGATLDKGRHIINGTLDFNESDPVMNFDVESYGVRAEPLVAIADSEFSLTGNINNVMRISGSPQHPRIEGQVALTDGSFQGYLLDEISGKYLYDDGFLSLQNFIVNLLVAKVEFSGTMSKEQELDFDLAANNVQISKIPYNNPNYVLEGLVDLDGHVGGFVKAPLFNGGIASEEIKINGERFTDISGAVSSNMQAKNAFDISFKQPHQTQGGDRKKGIGTFSASGNLDLTQEFLVGQVVIDDGDINGLLRTAKLDYAVEGSVDGLIDICPEGKGSGVVFDINSKSIDVRKLHYEKLSARGTFNDYILSLEELLLQEKSSRSDKGFIQVSGIVDWNQKQLNMHASAVEANPAIANIVMKEELDITGYMNLAAELTGSFASPKGEAKLDLHSGSLLTAKYDDISAQLSLADDNIQLRELLVTKDVYSMTGNGIVPVDALRAAEERKNPDAQMQLVLNFDNTELGILTALSRVDWATGAVKGQLNINGTLDEPRLRGNINIEDGSIKFREITPVFEQVKLAADFNGTKASLHNLSARVGSKGSISMEGHYDLNAAAEEAYRLHVSAKDAELGYLDMFKGVITSELDITPQRYIDYWRRGATTRTTAAPTGSGVGRLVKPELRILPRSITRKTRPLIKGTLRLDDTRINVLTVEDAAIGSETNLGLDVKLELGPKIHLLNALFYDIWLKGGLSLKGGYYSQTTADASADETIINRHNRGPDGLKIDGKITADKGSITYLRTNFRVTKGELAWTRPGELLPYVKLDSWSRFGSYRVYINIDGSLGDIKNDEILKLTSSPPLEKNTLVRMLTLQRETASGGNDISNDDLDNIMSAGLEMAVLGNVELWVKQALGLDQFRIYSGKVTSGLAFDGSDSRKELTEEDKTRYNVLVSKYITKNLMLGYTTRFDGHERIMFAQYDLGRHFNLTYAEKQELNSKRRNWYGLEYQIGFK